MKKLKAGLFCSVALLLITCPALYDAHANRTAPAARAEALGSMSIQLEPVLSGLTSPVYVTSAKDGTNRLFIVEQAGRILVLQPGATTPTVFLDITTRILSAGERGLLGLAFHPQYSVNRRFFVNYTRAGDGATVIAEYSASASNPNIANTAEIVLLTYSQPFANHNGGMIDFGPDGFLYIASGDGGSGNDPGNRAQNINVLLGKILRIDVDTPNGPVPYSSPPDNPFFGAIPGADEIYAFGLRNPWRFSFDRETGQLYVGDVGQGAREEVDIVTLGGNYGWRVFEGTLCTPNDPPLCNPNNFIPPITEYSHSGGRCSITGGFVYRGARSTLPQGAYVFADFCTGEIFTFENGVQSLLMDAPRNISSFGEDEAGEIYVVGLGGTIERITGMLPPPPCSYSISPTSESFPASGGADTFTLTTTNDCGWIAASNAPWINITSATSGSGSETVSYSVAPNTDPDPRSGEIHIAGETLAVNQDGQGGGCTFSINPTSQNFSAIGGSSSVNVTTQAGCNWTATSNAGFITITSGASGTGNGTVNYSVAANPNPSPRTGTMTIAGETFTVNQAAAMPGPCVTSISPAARTLKPSGGQGTINVQAPPGCAWTAVSDSPWLAIFGGASGTGNGTVSYGAALNSGTCRMGKITIGNFEHTVTQFGFAGGSCCAFSISPTSQNFAAAGGNSSVGVTASGGCNWTATSNAGFITITSGGSGSGNGTVTYSVAANPNPSPRTGTMTIAGQTFTVNQAAAPGGCTFSINPTSQNFSAIGGSSSVNVTTQAGCNWTATSNAGFITITSGASGTGNGTVNYSVAANPNPSPRTGTMTIAGQTFTVNQAAAACTFGINPTSQNFSSTGGTGSVNVTTQAGCAWTATSNAGFITITSGGSGTGNGTVTYSVAANPNPSPRTGTMTIAGQTFTVNQAAATGGCTFSINPTSKSFSKIGGSVVVNVTTAPGCSWTTTINAPWIFILSGGSGTGNGSVTLVLAFNTGPPRTGTVTIAGQTFTANQQ